MSVNDWKNWRRDGTDETEPYGAIADELERTMLKGWRPVSEPPTEEDGDKDGYVLFYGRWIGVNTKLWNYQGIGRYDYWARIRDVVLLPMEKT